MSSEQLGADVEARLGRPVFVKEGDADLVARVRARRASGRFLIEVELFDRNGRRLGQRELSTRARHCSALDDSLALVLALAVDAARTSEPVEPDMDATPRESSPPSPVALATPLSIPANTHAPRLGPRISSSVGLSVASGLFPSAVPGVEIGAALETSGSWRLSLRGTVWAEQRLGGREQGAKFSAHTLELGVCRGMGHIGGLGVAALCAVEWLGSVEARGVGFDESEASASWLAAFGVSPELRREVGPLFVQASGSLLVPLVRRRYFFTHGADVTLYGQPGVFMAGSLRLGTEF